MEYVEELTFDLELPWLDPHETYWGLVQSLQICKSCFDINQCWVFLNVSKNTCQMFQNENFTFSALGVLSLGQPPYSCESFFQDFLNPDNVVAGIKTNHIIGKYLNTWIFELWSRTTTSHVIGKYLNTWIFELWSRTTTSHVIGKYLTIWIMVENNN